MKLKHSISMIKTLETLDYNEIVDFLSETPGNENKVFQLKIFYREMATKHNTSKAILNACLLYVLRIKKGKIPSNKYLEKTLETSFKYCKTTADAAQVLYERLKHEIDTKEMQNEVKKAHQAKQSMSVAAKNYIGKDPERRIKQIATWNESDKQARNQQN